MIWLGMAWLAGLLWLIEEVEQAPLIEAVPA
jgi:hypothetical protein